MLGTNKIIERQKAYLEKIKKGEEKITEREIEEAMYSGDTVSWCDLDEYRFQIFKIALEKGYCHPDDICLPYLLTLSRNLYIRKYAIESILNDNPLTPKPEFLKDKLSYMEGDKDAEELSAYWDKYKSESAKQINSTLIASNVNYDDNKFISPSEGLKKGFKNQDMQDLKNVSSSLFKSISVANEISETSETPLSRP